MACTSSSGAVLFVACAGLLTACLAIDDDWTPYNNPAGTVCESNQDCFSSSCAGGRCTRAIGEICTENDQCPSQGQPECWKLNRDGICSMACTSHEQCTTGDCIDGRCVLPCSSDADCQLTCSFQVNCLSIAAKCWSEGQRSFCRPQ